MAEKAPRNTHMRYDKEMPKRNFFIDYEDDDIVFVENIEAISDAPPEKAPTNLFIFCHNGYIKVEVGGTVFEMRDGEVLVCPAGIFIRPMEVDPNTKFSALSLTDRIVQSLLNTNIYLWNHAVYVKKERVYKPQPEGEEGNERRMKMGWHFSEIMRNLLDIKENPFRKEMIYLMLQMVLLGYCAHYKDEARVEEKLETQDTHTPQGQVLFSRFMEMLNSEPVKHQPVYYYAERLCVSAKYLSHVCKTITGKTASDFIQNAVVGEIMHYLENTSLSVKEISTIMGFPNISFFGKYVKAHLGMSPNKYRK